MLLMLLGNPFAFSSEKRICPVEITIIKPTFAWCHLPHYLGLRLLL